MTPFISDGAGCYCYRLKQYFLRLIDLKKLDFVLGISLEIPYCSLSTVLWFIYSWVHRNYKYKMGQPLGIDDPFKYKKNNVMVI